MSDKDRSWISRWLNADAEPTTRLRWTRAMWLSYLALILISALFGAEVFDPTEELYPTPVFGFLMALLFVAAWAHLRLRRRFNLSVMQRIIDLSEDPQKQHMLLGTEMRLRGVGATGWLEVAAILILVFVFRDSLDWDTVPLVAVWVALGLLTFLHEAFLKEASYDRIAKSLGPPVQPWPPRLPWIAPALVTAGCTWLLVQVLRDVQLFGDSFYGNVIAALIIGIGFNIWFARGAPWDR